MNLNGSGNQASGTLEFYFQKQFILSSYKVFIQKNANTELSWFPIACYHYKLQCTTVRGQTTKIYLDIIHYGVPGLGVYIHNDVKCYLIDNIVFVFVAISGCRPPPQISGITVLQYRMWILDHLKIDMHICSIRVDFSVWYNEFIFLEYLHFKHCPRMT